MYDILNLLIADRKPDPPWDPARLFDLAKVVGIHRPDERVAVHICAEGVEIELHRRFGGALLPHGDRERSNCVTLDPVVEDAPERVAPPGICRADAGCEVRKHPETPGIEHHRVAAPRRDRARDVHTTGGFLFSCNDRPEEVDPASDIGHSPEQLFAVRICPERGFQMCGVEVRVVVVVIRIPLNKIRGQTRLPEPGRASGLADLQVREEVDQLRPEHAVCRDGGVARHLPVGNADSLHFQVENRSLNLFKGYFFNRAVAVHPFQPDVVVEHPHGRTGILLCLSIEGMVEDCPPGCNAHSVRGICEIISVGTLFALPLYCFGIKQSAVERSVLRLSNQLPQHRRRTGVIVDDDGSLDIRTAEKRRKIVEEVLCRVHPRHHEPDDDRELRLPLRPAQLIGPVTPCCALQTQWFLDGAPEEIAGALPERLPL